MKITKFIKLLLISSLDLIANNNIDISTNNLNINTKNNTHLKGSMIVAGSFDENGNFIDNKNLNLTTNTLTFENLSNTSYTKGSSLSIGLNYAFKDNQAKEQDKDSNGKDNQAKDLNNKITSATYSNNRNLNYNYSKTLATIGQGSLNIKDKDSSDDTDRLNRDTDKTNKDLYSTNISSNVDATIDTRLFSKDGREQVKQEYEYVVDKLDNFNRFVKDKTTDRLSQEQIKQIEQNGLENSLIQSLKEQGISDEKINLILSDEKVKNLISAYNNKNNIAKNNITKDNNTYTIKTNTTDGVASYELDKIIVMVQKNFQDYLVNGAQAIKSIVNIIGERNAATAILITQFATQGVVKASVSMLSDEAKEVVFGGVKNKISNYIADNLFDVNDGYWRNNEKQAIYSLSDVSADFSLDLAMAGPFALIKGAKNLVNANNKFDDSLGVNNISNGSVANSSTNSNHNGNNFNGNNGDEIVVAGVSDIFKDNTDISIKIDTNKQKKHIQGTNEYKTANQNGVTRSILTENIENLLPKLGTGQKINNIEIGLAGSKERIDFGKVIGYYIDEAGNKLPTTKGIVHYGKNGAHVVPSNPK